MRKILASLSLVLFVACAVPAHSAEVIAFDEGNPPFMYTSNGKAAGVYPALIAEAFKRMNVDVEIQAVPWKRALEGLDRGINAVGGIYKNGDRLKKYDYSEKLFDEVITVYVQAGKGAAFKGIDSLKGKTVGVIRGWSYGDDFDEAVKNKVLTVEPVAGDSQNFHKLVESRLDGVLAIKESAAAEIASSGLADKIEALSPPMSSNPSFLAFAKSSNKTDLIAKFNAALADMHRDGSFDKIVSSVLAK
jgi:polar amino acid transport system substrate-binding protein